MTHRRFCAALAIGFGVTLALHAQTQQEASSGKSKVDMVQTVGCVERRSGTPSTWWLSHAAEPTITATAFLSEAEIEHARIIKAGPNTFQLIGVADFRDKEGLLQEGERAKFTRPETANASGQLREGHTVAVKGLLVESGGHRRINLMTVLSLADTCRTN